jgi:hypothetical protein
MRYSIVAKQKEDPMPDDDSNLPHFLRPVDPEEWNYEDSATIKRRCFDRITEVLGWAESCSTEPKPVLWFEPRLVTAMLSLGLLVLQFFLTRADEIHGGRLGSDLVRGGARYIRRFRQARLLGTCFGKLKYWRTYFAPPEETSVTKHRGGIYPVDEQLGISGDGFTMSLVSLATRMSTKMAFDAAAFTLTLFLRWSPAKKTIEEHALGLGALAHGFQAEAPPPSNDGEVFVIQPDGKGIPTATDLELRRRRGCRKPNPHPESKRHRGRAKRRERGPRSRRKPGDKSKNARMATMVVTYTLKKATDKSGHPILLGPFNVRIFASFAPKKYAFQTARREAIKRGFGPDSGKLIQFVSDGDEDLETYRKEYFGDYPTRNVVVTADLPHVMEYLWSAGTALHKEGSGELSSWVRAQKQRLLASRANLVRRELRDALAAIPTRGPGNKGKRLRLEKALKYLTDNAARLDYKRVRNMDLELASGIVEGAIKHIIGHRFDHGGMRWIRERAEALLQLRCIEINGQWDDFIQWAHDKRQADALAGRRSRLRRATPTPLPTVKDFDMDDHEHAKAA